MKCDNCHTEIKPDPISGWDSGHNGQPLVDGRVCDDCNVKVIVRRLQNSIDKRVNR
jgi:hypothetical protein